MIGSPLFWLVVSGLTAIIGVYSYPDLGDVDYHIDDYLGFSWAAWLSDNVFSRVGVILTALAILFQCSTLVFLAT